MYFGNYALPKRRLDQFLKSPVSDYPSKRNMLNATKYCSHLKNSPFATFIDHWAANCPSKSLY